MAVPYPHNAPKPRRPRFVTLGPGSELVRIYDPSKYSTKPITFRNVGPKERFDHHRFQRNGKARFDEAHGVLYAALQFSTSLVEVFGDKRVIEYGSRRVGIIKLTREIVLLDLVDGAMAAGTVSALGSITSRRISQSWSRYFHRRTGTFGRIDGLYYNGSHNTGECVLLYERAADAVECDERTTVALSDKRWRPAILNAIQRYNLVE